MPIALNYLIIVLLLSVVNVVILQYMHSHRIKFFYTSIFLLIPFAILGDLFLALSTNLEEALLANKVAYLGSIYLPLILMFEIFHMCQIKTSFFIQMLLFIASTCIYVLSCTTGYSEIYYTNPQFITYAGVSNYTTEYGPAHILWNIYLILYFVVGATVLIYTFITKKKYFIQQPHCIHWHWRYRHRFLYFF